MPLFSQPVSNNGALDGVYIMAANEEFDLTSAMKETIRQQELGLLDDDLFDLSPADRDADDPQSSEAEDYQLPHTPKSSPLDLGASSSNDSVFDIRHLSPLTPEPESSPEISSKQRRKRKMKQQSRLQRKKRRAKARDDNYGNAPPQAKMSKKHATSSRTVNTSAKLQDSEVTSASFVALNKTPYPERVFTLEELIGRKSKWKFKLVKWDGITPVPIVDKDGVRIGLLVGRPNSPAWMKLMNDAVPELERARRDCEVNDKFTDHRRGVFTTLRTGFSHGGGQPHPMNLDNNATNKEIIDRLNAHEAFQRIAGLTSSTFQSQFPDLHQYYVEKLSALQARIPSLKKPFADSVFSSTTYNLGPRTECLPHVDFSNLAFGLCAVTALGTFESQLGGHLILWELGIVIEFPAGSTILIPSAVINHSNTAIADGERRYSFTQYSAGGLFRWVDHKFQKVETYRKSLKKPELAALDQTNSERWAYGLSLLPRVD